MAFAGFQKITDLHNKDRLLLSGIGILSFLRCQIRIHIFQFLRCDKRNFSAKLCMQMFILIFHFIQGIADGFHNTFHSGLQIIKVSIFFCDNFFPVPLIHISGMQIVQFFVTTNSIHITQQTFAYRKIIIIKCHTLPFCKRMYNLGFHMCIRNIKRYRSLHAVQIIVQTGSRINK